MNTKLWFDTADFQSYGQWKLDTQFTHNMGSAYLLACHAPGTPVEDASTGFALSSAGRYRVWARARNWYYAHSPGKFELSIDGKTSGAVLGALMSNDWCWQIAGDFELSAGSHTLALHDLTGYFGRCSSVVITDDMEYIPPRPVDEFERDRARSLGISLEPVDAGSYDLLVAGAGPGGVPAAIMAARMGCKVVLISNRPVIGGNASSEGGIGFSGASARQFNARDGGIVEEIMRIKNYNDREMDHGWGDAMTTLCEQEPNITIVYNEHIIGAETVDGTIVSATTRHTLKGTRHTYRAKQFVDATGDSWLGYYAGAKYRIGREGKWQFDEEFAPETADLLTMSGTVMGVTFHDSGAPVPYTRPAWATQLNEGKKFGRNIEKIGPAWWGESPNVLDDLYDGEITRDEILRVYISFFDYLKNLWEEKERAANHVFTYINHINKKRESRRLIGDYTLTQNDCMQGKDFPDTVGHAGWPIDIHHPEGIYSGEQGPFFSNTDVPLVKIPYRCLYSKNINNLFMAGRNASVSHIALGTARIQGTIGVLAQAVGIAASLCIEKCVTPREIGQAHLAEFQQLLLKWDGYIPGMKNEDPTDLARTATVTASSVSTAETLLEMLGHMDKVLPMDRQRATFLARKVSKEIPSLWLRLTNYTDQPIAVPVHIRLQADPDGYTTQEDMKIVTETVPANGEYWVEYKCDLEMELRYFWLYIDKIDGIGWRIIKSPPLDFSRSERNDDSEIFRNIRWQAHCVSMEPPIEYKANCAPENVINGYSRIQDAEQYAWVSSEAASLPQWIQLDLAQESEISSVHLTFDTDMVNPPMVHTAPRVPKELVRDYSIEIEANGAWKTVATATENIMRKRVHHFDAVKATRVRVNITATADGNTARLFEVRVY